MDGAAGAVARQFREPRCSPWGSRSPRLTYLHYKEVPIFPRLTRLLTRRKRPKELDKPIRLKFVPLCSPVLAGAGPLECLEGHAAAGEGGVAVQNDPWKGRKVHYAL